MMNKHIQDRFDQLLGFIKNPDYPLTIEHSCAAAREMLDTLLHTGLLLPDEYRAYHAQIRTARLVAGGNDLKRESDKQAVGEF